MTDLEITKACAEAMGYTKWGDHFGGIPGFTKETGVYDPLHDDAQAMALVKRFRLEIYCEPEHNNLWLCNKYQGDASMNADLNRAICECVAKMQAAK